MENITEWLSASEAAAKAPGGAMTVSNITALLRRGVIKGVKRGKIWFVDPESLQQYRPAQGNRPRISRKAF